MTWLTWSLMRHSDEHDPIFERLSNNPLFSALKRALKRFGRFRDSSKAYYFEVVLFTRSCPDCGGRLSMTGQSRCTCISCKTSLDPTISFQKSSCCCVSLLRKTFHYTCSKCSRLTPSRFLFNERVFDTVYFREMMRESRARIKIKKR